MITTDELPHMVTIKEAAKLCQEYGIGISRHHIRRLCTDGSIPCCKTGVKTLLDWDGLIRYLKNPSPIKNEGARETGVRAIPERRI